MPNINGGRTLSWTGKNKLKVCYVTITSYTHIVNCPKIYLVQAFALHNQFPSPIFDQREDKSEQEVATLMLLTLGLRHLARGGLITLPTFTDHSE